MESAGRRQAVDRADGRGDAAAVSIGRERISDRRRDLPAARRARVADGHGARGQGLRHHRAGQDRHDPQLAAGRSPPADRGSRGHHQVQGAPPRRRAEARGRAAESDAARRHHLRAREAVRFAQASVGEGAPLQAAARRAAALGESCCSPGAIRSRRRRSKRCARVLRTRAMREAGRRGRGVPKPNRTSAEFACRWSRPKQRRPRAREAVHACELDINRRQQQIEFNREQIAGARRARREVRGELDALEARREPGRGCCLPSGAGRRARRSRISEQRRRRAGAHRA